MIYTISGHSLHVTLYFEDPLIQKGSQKSGNVKQLKSAIDLQYIIKAFNAFFCENTGKEMVV